MNAEPVCKCRKHAIDPRCAKHGIGRNRYLLNLATGVLVVTMALLAIFTAPADAHRVAKRPKWISQFAWAVAICETGKGHNHPDYSHRSSSYGGAWGWFVPTWQLDRFSGMPRYPWLATPRQQYRVFLRGHARGRYWGCIAGGGYKSWL